MRHTPAQLIWKTFTWSVASCIATLSLTLPTRLQAGDEAQNGPRAAIVQPMYTGDGFGAAAFFAPGDSPKVGDPVRVELVLVNNTDASISVEPVVQFSLQPTPSRMSRVPAIPREIGRQSVAVTLAPRERKQVRVETDVRRPVEGTLLVGVGDGKSFISSASLASAAKR